MEPIRLPARTSYDTLDDYIHAINGFEYSSPSFESFKAILNSDIEPQHIEQCILWYNSFDQTLYHNQSKWDIYKRPRGEPIYLEDSYEREAREAEERERIEGHEARRRSWYDGNPVVKTMKERTDRERTHYESRHPGTNARNEAALKESKKKKTSFWKRWLGSGKTRKKY